MIRRATSRFCTGRNFSLPGTAPFGSATFVLLTLERCSGNLAGAEHVGRKAPLLPCGRGRPCLAPAAAALVGCGAGAVPVDESRAMLEETGFTSIVLTPKPDYVRNMQDWNDPLRKWIIETLPKGGKMADYVVSLPIEARK